MISFSNINKQYGKQLLFVDASFQLNPGEKVGLVGPNGSGKTTLFRIVVGEETPDEGAVSVPKNQRRHVMHVLEGVGGNKVWAAEILGIGRATIYQLLSKMKLEEQADESPSRGPD